MSPTSVLLGALAGAAAILAAGWVLPAWIFVISIALTKGLAVLGLVLLMRAGLVSFGQGLFFAIGGYSAGLLVNVWRITEAALLVPVSALSALAVAAIVGLLLARYRDIFFAMLTLALSMILYGLLVKSSEFGGTDGFNIHGVTLFGLPLGGASRFNGLVLLVVLALAAVALSLAFCRTPLGRLAPGIKDREIRVEYLGADATGSIYAAYLLAALIGGVGGAMSGIAVGHIDPELAFWATSGEFVVIGVLAGTGSVLTPFVAALALELVRTYAYQYAPNTWQAVLGIIILALILFMPGGLSGLARRPRRNAAPEAQEPSGAQAGAVR
ncbi:branched-chain amino acid ABC transporter permease [Methylobacterium brachiatum]|uniref:branched-chain amino acid ABC transporter permease n=1 Tax=Methylobacterium brachiatum TaxID=269660 RepID=UPI000EFD83D2|nr:branched-chain amino acid ABC transporter permease [Methylobacterium brachiatum]AYO84731.1 branched-chain amino acid ABC transporter permease [Methylobacterium brachiatum]